MVALHHPGFVLSLPNGSAQLAAPMYGAGKGKRFLSLFRGGCSLSLSAALLRLGVILVELSPYRTSLFFVLVKFDTCFCVDTQKHEGVGEEVFATAVTCPCGPPPPDPLGSCGHP